MKLYLSSYRIPTPDDLAALIGKPLDTITVALIPNAKDYYSKRAWDFKVNAVVAYIENFGSTVDIVDLRDYSEAVVLKEKLAGYDLVWVGGGNTFVLRYEIERSGFAEIIKPLLEDGLVYLGESAGAVAAGLSLDGIEDADEPEFAEKVILDGLGIVPFHVLPHADNVRFIDSNMVFKQLHGNDRLIELKDSEAVIFNGESYKVVAPELAV